ncbi:helix-turn-helix transcriptional regulator [Actinocorallia longicatena]|uniref:helix-turn-helix domain-containing protein n=1 Tax=Actinocorallia longicatena TaxID=111803 RepID=UPI0031DEB808
MASIGAVTVRTAPSVLAGTLAYDAEDLVTGWHHHDLHQLEYALEGVAEVETAAGRYLVPPRQAIWVPAGTEHNTILRGVKTASVFFDPSMLPGGVFGRATVVAAAPLLREMIVYALRWPIRRTAADARADTYFSALALIIEDGLGREQPLWLPTSTDPLVAAVIAHTERHLASVTAGEVSDALHISERTLRRRFHDATGTTWREFVVRARLIRAMALLAEPGANVLEVGTAVGFTSPSAFSRAFRSFTGRTPTEYRRPRETEPGPQAPDHA